MEDSSQSCMYRKTYRLDSIYRALSAIFFVACWFPFVFVIILLFTRQLSSLRIYFSGVFIVIGLLFFFWQMSIPRVIVSDSGIEHYMGIYSLRATWSEVESYKIVAGYGISKWGLWLRKPAIKALPLFGWYVSFLKALLANHGDISRSIPLQPFGGINWQNSALMNDVKRYLPHLFTEKANTKELED